MEVMKNVGDSIVAGAKRVAFLLERILELINRARANPAAEGQRLAASTDPNITSSFTYFGVNLWISGLHSYAGV